MASSYTSHIQKSFKYDVFLSFRGEDTRKTISDELIRAIEESRFYIIVFSKNYASSSWCLEELVKIMECEKMTEHTAYPVFYDVEPTEVRKLYGPVGEAFKKHENDESAGKWREALKEAASLAGWELKTTAAGHEANFIQKIIQDISLELRFIDSSFDGNLVGMETRVNEVISSLEMGVDDVRMIGIKGMGGAGKTTLARAVFDKLSFQFEGQSFVENIREKSSLSGLNSLQKQVLSDVLNDQGITVSGVHEGKKMIKKKMRVRKVLIVLDDVDKIEQLEALVGDRDWFKPGSRIIITTREEQVLVAQEVNLIRDVHLLDEKEAICLFSRHAFRREIPIEGYKELSEQVVCYAAGLPLTIQVLGSFLHGKDDREWEDAIDRLKTIPLRETIEKLKLSYDDLEEDYKEIFLDVACILKGWSKDDAVIALKSCGFPAPIGLRVLELKSLITISEAGYLDMHDHIEEMGKNIVRRVNPNIPERHSRLWIKEEIVDISANESGTQATKCITLDACPDGLNFEILMNGLANMKELRFLHVQVPYDEDEVSNWNFDEDSLHLPNALQFLSWTWYPFSSLPKTFQAKNLVGLDMAESNIIQLWKDGEQKACLKLRFLKITFSKLRTLDLSVAPNLETLILQNCDHLVEVHFQVTANLKELRIRSCHRLEKLHMPAESPKLRSLNLNDSKLTTLHLGITPNLKTLSLGNCYNMIELHMPAECPKLVYLYLHLGALRTLDLGLTPNLQWLYLDNCCDLEEINAPAECLKKLLYLEISHCGRLRSFQFPKEFDSHEVVVTLSELHLIAYANDEDDADDIGICDPSNTWPEFKFSCYYKEDPASSFGNLERLISLGFGARINVDSFSDIICGLQCLRKLTLEGGIREVPKNLGRLDRLEELSLRSTDIKNLPDSICMLKHLKSLEIISCRLLEKLPEDIGRLQCLEKLIVKDCIFLRDIPNNICEMDRLEYLDLTGCIRIEELPEEIGRLECLNELDITGTGINRLSQSIFQLRGLNIRGSTQILEHCILARH
ncbi:disease resistance protein (TIR-NBS-LRR class) family [Artemisia annua]|uniref:Disease resistance protein (TIR-NBS-LRR class) family n=1 Tax=Artemisia annua TaxID=35608 RepID=A0A2U1KVZ5_ARTAN|nr:disease resistance protein (TIR-NBS-LRR class) family [Artemisia annua]